MRRLLLILFSVAVSATGAVAQPQSRRTPADGFDSLESINPDGAYGSDPRAALSGPKFPRAADYLQVRAAMIRAGYHPVAILRRPDHNGVHCETDAADCRRYPERYDCGSPGVCLFLYRRERDGQMRFVIAMGEGDHGYTYVGQRFLSRYDRQELRRDFVIAKPDPKGSHQSR